MTPQEALNSGWIAACLANEIEPDDVARFDHGGRTFALYRTADDKFYATDGICTHAKVHLAGGLVMDHLIECPKHNGRFDFTTGKAQGAPVCVDLKTYEVKVDGGRLFLRIA
jgi:3-phenylpropionate/trans-cinnamate dioxygenase ferredoxin subunit